MAERVVAPQSEKVAHDDNCLKDQISNSFWNFHDHVLGGHHNRGTDKDQQSEEALEYALETTTRNNLLSDLIHSKQFKSEIRDLDKQTSSDAKSGEIYCTDGRIPRYMLPFDVNTQEVLGGIIAIRERPFDKYTIPKGTSLCEAIRSKESIKHGLVEKTYGHYDSVNIPNKGCAANTKFLDHLAKKPEAYLHLFSADEIDELFKLSPQEANLRHIERTTARAITNFYNSARIAEGYPPLQRVCTPGLIDTAHMGVEFRSGNDIISTTDLSQRYREFIDSLDIAPFGDFHDTFTQDSNYFDLQKARAQITNAVMTNKGGLFTPLLAEIASYINRNYFDLQRNQAQRWTKSTVDIISWQHLTGLSKYTPDHAFANHNERVLALSDRGLLIGKYLPDQIFGTTAADPKDGANQVAVETEVLDQQGLVLNQPRILFICGSASAQEIKINKKSLSRAKQDMADMLLAIVSNPNLKKQMQEGRLIPMPVLLDDVTRKVLAVPDFSPYF